MGGLALVLSSLLLMVSWFFVVAFCGCVAASVKNSIKHIKIDFEAFKKRGASKWKYVKCVVGYIVAVVLTNVVILISAIAFTLLSDIELVTSAVMNVHEINKGVVVSGVVISVAAVVVSVVIIVKYITISRVRNRTDK